MLALAGKGLSIIWLVIQNPFDKPALGFRHSPPPARASDRQSPPHVLSGIGLPGCAPAIHRTGTATMDGVSFSSAPLPKDVHQSGKWHYARPLWNRHKSSP